MAWEPLFNTGAQKPGNPGGVPDQAARRLTSVVVEEAGCSTNAGRSAARSAPRSASVSGKCRVHGAHPAVAGLSHCATAAATTALRSVPAIPMTSAMVPPNIIPMSPTSSWET